MRVIASGPVVAAYGITYEAKFIDHSDGAKELDHDWRYEVYIETQIVLTKPAQCRHKAFLCNNFIGAARYFQELVGETLDAYERKWSI